VIERLTLILLYIYLLLNLPFPSIIIKKIPLTEGGVNIDFEPVTAFYRARIRLSGNFDSLKVEGKDYSQTVYNASSLELPLSSGINRFNLSIYKGKEHSSKTIQIYKLQEKTRIAVLTSQFNPLFKVINSHGTKRGDLTIQPFVIANNEWITLEKNSLVKVKNPDFTSFNALIIDNTERQILYRRIKFPVCLIDRSENIVKLNNAFIVSDRFKLRAKNITLSPVQREVKDTIIWIEPNKIPLFFLGADGNFYFNLENLFELSLKSPEITDSILNLIIENISYPKFKIISLNQDNYLLCEPPHLPEHLLVEASRNGKKMPTSSLIQGYLKITPEKEVDTIKVTAKVMGKVIYDTTFVLHNKLNYKDKKQYKAKIHFTVLPSQSSSLFLILLFIYTALIYTFGRTRRQKDENG
jgi:hypothetical protein